MCSSFVLEPSYYLTIKKVEVGKRGEKHLLPFYEGYKIKKTPKTYYLGYCAFEKKYVEDSTQKTIKFFYPLIITLKNGGFVPCFPNYSFRLPYLKEELVKEIIEKIREKILYAPNALKNSVYPLQQNRLSPQQMEIINLLNQEVFYGFKEKIGVMNNEAYIAEIEKRLRSKGRYVADWYEFKRSFYVEDQKINLLARGNMGKMKTGFLAKFFAKMIIPQWETMAVVLFSDEEINVKKFISFKEKIKSYMDSEDIKWAWVNITSKKIGLDTVAYVENYLKPEIGVFLTDLTRKEMKYNPVPIMNWGKRIFKVKLESVFFKSLN